MTPSLFREASGAAAFRATAIALALTGARGVASLHAQSATPPVGLRVSLDSEVERVGAPVAGAPGTDGGSRAGLELFREHPSRRGNVSLWTGVTADQFWGTGTAGTLASAASVDSSLTLTRRMKLEMGERVSLTPLDLFAALGSADPAAVQQRVVAGSELRNVRTLSHTGHAALTRTLGARTQATVSAAESVSWSGADRVISSGANGLISRRVGPYAGWHVGYGVTHVNSSLGAERSIDVRHDVDAGVDYARPLPFWRHSSFGVTTGTTLLSERDGRRLRMNAAVHFDRRVTPHWAVTADYSRPIQYVAGLLQPLLSDAVRVGVDGRLGRRLALSLSTGGSFGSLGLSSAAHFASYTGAVRLSRQLGPDWRLQLEYHDAWYRFDASPGGAIPMSFERRGFRSGVVWDPFAGR